MVDDDRARLRDGARQLLTRPWQIAEGRRLALDAFAQRYAAARGLTFSVSGHTPPATWFLESVAPERSHGFVTGDLGEGVSGELFYAEREIPRRRTAQIQGWTVGRVALGRAGELAYGLACVWRRPEAVWGGRVRLPSALPRDTIEVAVGDETLDARRLTAISSHDDAPAVSRLFTDEFVDWCNELPFDKTGAGVLRFELRGGVLVVYERDTLDAVSALDRFRAHTAHIAAHIRDAAQAARS